MIFGYASRLGGRATWLLLVVGGLLIWAGRSDASLLGPGASAPRPESAPRLDRIDDGDVEARLVISGQMLVLRLRGGDLAALAERIAADARPEIAIRVDGQELLAAELRDVQVEGDRLESLPPEPLRLQLEPPALLAAAVAAGGMPPADAAETGTGFDPEEAEPLDRRVRAEPTSLPVPEPGAAALLAAGLLGLGLAGRPSGRAAQAPPGRGMA